VKFHPKVTGWLGAILKNEVAVCGGWVMVRPPAGAVWGIEREEVLELVVERDEDDPAEAGVWFAAIVLRRETTTRENQVRKQPSTVTTDHVFTTTPVNKVK
jgi:hypothetical protein